MPTAEKTTKTQTVKFRIWPNWLSPNKQTNDDTFIFVLLYIKRENKQQNKQGCIHQNTLVQTLSGLGCLMILML